MQEHYWAHHDYFDPNIYRAFVSSPGQNRFITVFFYLSDVEEGGEVLYLSTSLPLCLSTSLRLYLSTSLPLYLSTFLPPYLSSLSISLPLYLPLLSLALSLWLARSCARALSLSRTHSLTSTAALSPR